MLNDVKDLEVTEIVGLGDHMDCGGFLMMNHTLGYVAEMDENNFEDDASATNEFLDKIQKNCPNADFHMLQGNHEHRIERWAVDTSKGNQSNARLLTRQFGPENVLNLKKRGIKYYRIGDQHMGLEHRGMIKLGKSYYVHGISTAKHAANVHVSKFGANVFYGHTHRADMSMIRLIDTGLVGAWTPGCLCQLSARYLHHGVSDWSQGYILQIVDRDSGNFHAIHVPIENGKSYLLGLVNALDRDWETP